MEEEVQLKKNRIGELKLVKEIIWVVQDGEGKSKESGEVRTARSDRKIRQDIQNVRGVSQEKRGGRKNMQLGKNQVREDRMDWKNLVSKARTDRLGG